MACTGKTPPRSMGRPRRSTRPGTARRLRRSGVSSRRAVSPLQMGIRTACATIACSACRTRRSGSSANADRPASKNAICPTCQPMRTSKARRHDQGEIGLQTAVSAAQGRTQPRSLRRSFVTGSAKNRVFLTFSCSLEQSARQTITWLCGKKIGLVPRKGRKDCGRGAARWPMADFRDCYRVWCLSRLWGTIDTPAWLA